MAVSALQVKAKYSKQWMELDGVVGVGIGQNARGQTFLRVYVKAMTDQVKRAIPKKADGVKVDLEPVGTIKPRRAPR